MAYPRRRGGWSGDVVATIVAGVLYAVASSTVAFGYAAAWMAIAIIASGMLRPSHA